MPYSVGNNKQKWLIISIMVLRQSYEGKEINEIRWIYGKDNQAEAMTKASQNLAFESIITTNKAVIRLEA